MKRAAAFLLVSAAAAAPICLQAAGKPPWPTPPPEDDDPFLLLPADPGSAVEALRGLMSTAEEEGLFEDGGRLVRATTRRWRSSGATKLTIDFLFYRGPGSEPGISLYRVVRYEKICDLETGSECRSDWTISPTLALKPPRSALPEVDFASSLEALVAVTAALEDSAVQELLKGFLPVYFCQNIETHFGGYENSGTARVVFQLVNQQDRTNRQQLAVEVSFSKRQDAARAKIVSADH